MVATNDNRRPIMFRRMKSNFFSGFCLLFMAAALAEAHPESIKPFGRDLAIFVTEIQSVQINEGCTGQGRRPTAECRTKVHVQVIRVLQNGGNQDVIPREFDADLVSAS